MLDSTRHFGAWKEVGLAAEKFIFFLFVWFFHLFLCFFGFVTIFPRSNGLSLFKIIQPGWLNDITLNNLVACGIV